MELLGVVECNGNGTEVLMKGSTGSVVEVD